MKRIFFLLVAMLINTSCEKKSSEKVVEKNSLKDTLRQKDGQIISFKKYPKSLIKMMRDQTQYSEGYQQRIEKVVEYYLANTQQSLVKYQMEKPNSNIGFSMEENDWEGVDYTQVGVFNKLGSNASTLQWLFYEPKSQKLYEFDLNKKKLQEFQMK